jgi:hypothetical protein
VMVKSLQHANHPAALDFGLLLAGLNGFFRSFAISTC